MSTTPSRVLKGLASLLAALAIVAYVGYLIVYVVYAVELFQWPFDYDQGEGFELYDAILYSRGEWPYRDSARFPFYASNYPPVFHLLIVPLLPIFGPRLIAGRLLSFIATLIAAGTIFIVVRRNIGNREQRGLGGWFIPLMSGLGFLASNYVYQIGPLCRMHMTLVMFETLAIAFVGEFQHTEHGTRNLILGVVMLFLAGYTKQTAVFTVAAALSHIFLRDIRKALLAGAGLALAAGSVFWLVNLATNGSWWVNIIQANVNEFDYRQSLFLFEQWLRLHTVFVLLAGGYFVFELFWGRLSVYSLWFFFALGVGALSGKWGAGFGYFTTAVAAACLASGLCLGKLWEKAPTSSLFGPGLRIRIWRLLGLVIPLAYLLQAPRMLHLPTSGAFFGPLSRALGVDNKLVYGRGEHLVSTHCAPVEYYDAIGYTQLGHPLGPEDYAGGAKIMSYVLAADGPVLSEEAMFSLLAGKPVVTNPTQLLNLYNNDLLATAEIVDRVNQQAFDLVIFRAQFYPPPVLQAVGQNYRPVDQVCMNGFTYHILWPGHRPGSAPRLSRAAPAR
ncbi:MAG: hypothetical protein PVF54_00480 [Anaerolineae bacterium]|jgi:hypothetical protein